MPKHQINAEVVEGLALKFGEITRYMTQADVARRLGEPEAVVNRVLNLKIGGRVGIHRILAWFDKLGCKVDLQVTKNGIPI